MIYPYPSSRIWKKDNLVYKYKPDILNLLWRKKMGKILKEWELPAFYDFMEGGYITHYINGTDLHGTTPFLIDSSCGPCILNTDIDIKKALSIYETAITIGEKLGFTFGDITLGNIMVDHMDMYLIDYDSIVNWPLKKDVKNVWFNSLKMIAACEVIK